MLEYRKGYNNPSNLLPSKVMKVLAVGKPLKPVMKSTNNDRLRDDNHLIFWENPIENPFNKWTDFLSFLIATKILFLEIYRPLSNKNSYFDTKFNKQISSTHF